MDIKDWFYTLLTVSQLFMLVRVWWENSACGRTRQSRWICRRMTVVTVNIGLMTVLSWQYHNSGDGFLDGALAVGMAALTLALGINLPSILDGMSNEQVGEDLNIRMNGLDS